LKKPSEILRDLRKMFIAANCAITDSDFDYVILRVFMENPDFKNLKTEKIFEIFEAGEPSQKLRETDELFELERSHSGQKPPSSKLQ
jgi:hypothetical protein